MQKFIQFTDEYKELENLGAEIKIINKPNFITSANVIYDEYFGAFECSTGKQEDLARFLKGCTDFIKRLTKS
jgi:hypothetical protein